MQPSLADSVDIWCKIKVFPRIVYGALVYWSCIQGGNNLHLRSNEVSLSLLIWIELVQRVDVFALMFSMLANLFVDRFCIFFVFILESMFAVSQLKLWRLVFGKVWLPPYLLWIHRALTLTGTWSVLNSLTIQELFPDYDLTGLIYVLNEVSSGAFCLSIRDLTCWENDGRRWC